jgi:hypothetical protein
MHNVRLLGTSTPYNEYMLIKKWKNAPEGGGGLRKSNSGGEFDQSKLYACIEISWWNCTLYNKYTLIKKREKEKSRFSLWEWPVTSAIPWADSPLRKGYTKNNK